ncbi:MAG: peptidylprolyl isomerase [bacterium]|nr:peptidylprolyl isomerase [bacterium]
MALIGKIREKSWLLLIVVGGAIVVFIFTSGGPNFGGGVEEEYGIGLMYGEKLDRDGYNSKLDEAREVAKTNAARSGQPVQEVNEDLVWSQFVEESLLEKEYEALGIHVSEDEFDAFLYARNGFDPLPDLKNNFKDAAGNFDPKALENQINQLKSDDSKDAKKAWEQTKDYYMDMRRRQKYFDIVAQGMYVTNLEAKQQYMAENEMKAVKYVVMNYNTVKEESIDMSEKALRAFYKKHKSNSKYKNRRSERLIRWADIKVLPSAKDSAEFERKLENLVKGFKNTKNDSLFTVRNAGPNPLPYASLAGFRPEGSENQMATQGFTYPADMDSVFKNAEVGDVIGPYEQAGGKRVAKVISKGPLYSVRHILISGAREDSVAVAKAKKTTDSLMPLITSANFEEYVTEFSDDQPSVAKGGKYENFLSKEMVPEFEEFAKEKAIGTIGYVQTQFGYHIIEVLDRQEDVVPSLAVVQRTLTPSMETINNAETSAYELLDDMYTKMSSVKGKYAKVVKFDTLAKREGMIVRTMTIAENEPKVSGGFSNEFAENELLRLAFEEGAEVGDLVQSPIKDGDRWVVAALADIKVKGETTFENARSMVEAEYVKEMKYRRLYQKMIGKTLSELEQQENLFAQTGEVVLGKSNLGPGAREPQVVGALFSGLKPGSLSQPLKGNAGVYVVKVEELKNAPETTDFSVQKNQMLATRRGQVQSAAMNALKDMAEIIDNRRFYEINIRK